MNRRRPPAIKVQSAAPAAPAKNTDAAAGDATSPQAQSSTVFVSPMSTTATSYPTTAGTTPQLPAAASGAPASSSSSSSFAANVQNSETAPADRRNSNSNNTRRPSALGSLPDSANEGSETAHSASSPLSSTTVHRRPSQEGMRRRSSAASLDGTPGSPASRTAAAKRSSTSDTSDRDGSAPQASAPAAAKSKAAHVLASPDREAFRRRLSAPTTLTVHTNKQKSVPSNNTSSSSTVSLNVVNLGARLPSYQTLESPQDDACAADLGVAQEGVDWERVDADPQELFRQRNRNAASSQQESNGHSRVDGAAPRVAQKKDAEPTLPAQPLVLSSSWSLVAPSPKSKENGSLSSTHSTEVPELAATGAPHDQAKAAGAAETEGEEGNHAVEESPRQLGTSPPPWRVRENVTYTASSFSSMQTESVALDTEDPIDVRVNDDAAVASGDGVVAAPQSSDELDQTLAPLQQERDDGDRLPGVLDVHDKNRQVTTAPSAASADAFAPRDGEVNIFVAVRIRPCSSAASASTGGSGSGGQKRVGGRTGKHGGGQDSGNNNKNNAAGPDALVGSCVHADARRGFVDCSTFIAAAVPGAGGGDTAAAAASADATAVAAAGKQARTLRFFFDHILDEHVSQRELMGQIGQRAVERVLAGYHGTVMCYGQSGSGKTHTVVGPNGGRLTKKALRWRTSVAGASSSSLMATDTQEAEAAVEEPGRPAHTADAEHDGSIKEEVVRFAPEVGLLPRMLHALFSGLEAQRLESEATAVGAGADGSTAALASWRVTFSALELYNEELRDLLPQELKIASTAKNKTTTKKKKAKPITAAEEGNSAASSSSPPAAAAAAAANGNNGEGGVITSPIQATPLRKPRPGSASTPSSPPAGSRSTNRRGGPASPFTLHTAKRMEAGRSAGKTATAVDSANNSSVGPSPFTRFPTYPGLFSSANSSGGEHLANLQSWGAEDLEVLNAVSSSDHDDDDDDDGDKDADTDGDEEDEDDDDEDDEEEENEEDSDEEEEEEAGIDAVGEHPSGDAGDPRPSASPHGATHDQRYSLNSVLLSPPSQQRLGFEEAGEPDPSRPTVNDGDDDDDEYARGRLTIGQVISVSPSLARPSANISKGAKKSAGGTAESSPPAAAAGQGGKSNGKATMLQTRVGRRLAGATTTTTAAAAAAGSGNGGASGSSAAPKSPSPTQRVSAAKGSTSPVRKPVSQTATAAATAAQTTSSATAATSASAASSVAPSTKRGGKTTLKKPRSVTRPRPTASGASTTTSTAVMREAGGDVYIEGLREHPIRNLYEGMVAVRRALRRRQMASTELNSDSSRAHTFFFIRVEQKQWRRRPSSADEKGDAAATKQSDGAHGGKLLFDVRQSTLTLVDLAGSERVGHTGAHGLRLKEAQNINLSLSALGNVMRLLSASSLSSAATAAGAGTGGGSDAHIPYRDSKLTRILQSSLGGNAITFLLCNVSPDRRDAQETMSTLRFAKLSKTVKNKAKLNLSVSEEASKEGVSSAVLQRYKEARQAAQEAAAAAQRKLAAAALDASEQQRKLRQLAAYAWWLEEQLGCVVNQVTARKADTQRKRMDGGGPDEDKGAEALEEEEDWWRLSPRPRTPPAQPTTSTPQRSTSGSTKAKSSPQRQASASPPSSSPPASKSAKVRVTATHRSQKTTATATADLSGKSPESPNSYYWASPSAKTFLSAPYALDERQRELQSRLVAAAAAAGLTAGGAIATARGSVLTTVGGLTLAPSSPPQRQQDGLGGHNNASVVNAAASSASARPSAPSLVSPSPTPETQYVVQHDPLADARGAASLTDAPAANATALNGSRAAAGSGGSGLQGVLSAFQAVSPPASFRESVRGASERAVDSAAESRLGLHTGHGASSGVFVSASSLADAGSPCLSALTEAQSQRHSAAPPTPAAGPLHGQAVSNFAVALAEERRAREAAQAQLRAVELQNLLLRLRLATLDAHHQQQQQQQQNTVEAAAREKSPSPSPSLTRKPRSTADGAAVATTLSKSSQRGSGGAAKPGTLSPLSDSAPFHRTSTSPPPPSSSSWPPHYDRRSVEASLETFLARCGFVPLDSRVKGDGGANAGKGSSHAPTAAAGGSLTSPTVTYAWSGAGVPPFQLQQHGVMESPPFRGSPLSSPYDTHSQRSITVNPDSVQKLREGSRGRADDDESAAAAPAVSIARRRLDNSSDSDSEKGFDDTGSPPAICTVLAVVNTEGKPHHGGTAAEDKETHALQHNTQVRAASVGGGGGDGHSNSNSSTVQGRGSVQRRPRAASSPSPEATPSAGSSGWGQQLLTSVRTTIETVRAMSSHENFYDPDDINVSADEGAISPPLEAR